MFKSLKFVLKDSRTCLCLMRHRPIKKVRKNPAILILGVVVNFVVAYLFYYTLKVFWITPNFAPFFHKFFTYGSAVCFLILVPSFVMSIVMDPGYLRKTYDYIDLVQDFLHQERDLMNLCTYCQLIKSETSFHCLFCGKCTEMFDHHCPFINNCLGNRNYKYFLLFIFSYFLFLAFTTAELIRYNVDTIEEN